MKKILTIEDIEKGQSIHGGYTKSQILEWGGEWPLVKGWKNRLIGKEVKVKTSKSITSFFKSVKPRKKSVTNSNKVYNSFTEIIDENIVYIYTDGACIHNGKPNAKAGYGIFFGKDDKRNTSKPVIKGNQTNNYAELIAINDIFDILENDEINKNIVIVSDSKYAIRCCTDYGNKISDTNKNAPNKELIIDTYNKVMKYPNISFIHIYAHTTNTDIHSLGNDQADKLANKSIGLESCPYDKVNNIYLNIPFKDKEEIKSLKGKWDTNGILIVIDWIKNLYKK